MAAQLPQPTCKPLPNPVPVAVKKCACLLDASGSPAGYMPLEISRECLLGASSRNWPSDFPDGAHRAPCAPITARRHGFPCRQALATTPMCPGWYFFPAPPLAILNPPPAANSSRPACARLAGPGGALLIGADLQKDPIRASMPPITTAEGLTAAFNMNALHHLNARAGLPASTSPPNDAACGVLQRNARQRIEMHLECLKAHSIHIHLGERTPSTLKSRAPASTPRIPINSPWKASVPRTESPPASPRCPAGWTDRKTCSACIWPRYRRERKSCHPPIPQIVMHRFQCRYTESAVFLSTTLPTIINGRCGDTPWG